MRLYEILLVVSCLALLITSIFHTKFPRKTSWITGIVSMLVLVTHLVVEGYRWQLIMAYVVTIVLIGSVLLRNARANSRVRIKMWRPVVYISYAMAFLMIGVSTYLSVSLPVIQFPQPSGLLKVGTQTFHFTDTNRDEMFTDDESDKRELMVQVWYPADLADKNTRRQSKALFPEQRDIFETYMQEYAKLFKLPSSLLDYWKYARSHSYEHAELHPATKPYPLVLISHGMGTSRIMHTAQAEHLASHRYIVAAIDHTYSSVATAFPAGNVTGYTTEINGSNFYEVGKKVGAVWTEDVHFVIKQFQQLNAGTMGTVGRAFKGKIDVHNIGVMGHSFGGATAFNAGYLNPHIKAVINMDGTIIEVDNRTDINKPFLFMKTDNYRDIIKKSQQGQVPDAQLKKHIAAELAIMDRVVKHGGSLLFVEGSGHFNFTDFQLFSELLKFTGATGEIHGERSAFIVNQYVLDFFNKHLKGTGGELMDGVSDAFPEVTFY
ncbi:alpha/beta hydrolase family protein [Paenibacillus sp. 481]|uniref:alpha/beta hydrolase family protein n=1 Tax=Paenibacillus sp. 481 TaxID=2835869 RepID=UPI001E346853|nr:Platelet-activating factor acetylhydrolase plasma/intracellular isoform II [Paenibacillus sp. 481]UHA75121.1 Platelet-activating factor acetylhydrolase plasma/intracellular isoform II [Paenibacillus sp. 481]